LPKTLTELKTLIQKRIETLDVENAKFDVTPFIKDTSTLDIWSRDYFRDVAEQVQ
jgi:hypothetical protein